MYLYVVLQMCVRRQVFLMEKIWSPTLLLLMTIFGKVYNFPKVRTKWVNNLRPKTLGMRPKKVQYLQLEVIHLSLTSGSTVVFSPPVIWFTLMWEKSRKVMVNCCLRFFVTDNFLYFLFKALNLLIQINPHFSQLLLLGHQGSEQHPETDRHWFCLTVRQILIAVDTVVKSTRWTLDSPCFPHSVGFS